MSNETTHAQNTILDLNESTFDAAVADGVTVVDFWRPGAGPAE